MTYLSMYGIRAPGALSLRPFWNCMKQVAANLNLFLGGSEMLGRTSTLSGGRSGLAGLLISMSSGLLPGIVVPELDGKVGARWSSIDSGFCIWLGCGRDSVLAGADGMAAGADSTRNSSLSDVASMAETVQQRELGGKER